MMGRMAVSTESEEISGVLVLITRQKPNPLLVRQDSVKLNKLNSESYLELGELIHGISGVSR